MVDVNDQMIQTRPGYLGDGTEPVKEGECHECARRGESAPAIARCSCSRLVCESDYDAYNDRCFMCNP